MGSIYSLAQHTVIYLGELSMESEVVFAALQATLTEKGHLSHCIHVTSIWRGNIF
ncbi:hypothetical protein DL98DRAFT_509576 [Cadophora sp. DSE1049]|nr:hypothetical protein DL98DRAFT_509576 [Cadophora sp. DSE1049]